MEVAPLRSPERGQLISAYGDGGFRVAGARYRGSVLVLPKGIVAWPVRAMTELDAASLDQVRALADELDLVLMGCGRHAAPLPEGLRRKLSEAGLAIEAMDTGAACRTFNVLLAEGRRVAAALIAVA
jgi:uncharacterized protein